MRCSLVLCTKNGGERLGNCLSHIENMHVSPDLDIVVVDNGSDDGVSWPMIERFAAESRHAVQAVRCFRPGNSAGRNDGIKVAKGDILIFIDDDCYPAPDLAEAWAKVFREEGVGYGTGMILNHDPEMSFVGCNESPDAIHLAPGYFVEAGFLQGSNMAFSRACLNRAGLFDERFGTGVPYAGEDWDMGIRASFAGFAGGYFPGPKVSHDHRRTKDDVIRLRAHFYQYGAGAVLAKHMRGRRFPMVALRLVRTVKRTRHHRDGKNLVKSLLKGWRDFYFRERGGNTVATSHV